MTGFSVDSIIDGILNTAEDEPANVCEDINLAIFVDESVDAQMIACIKNALMPTDDHVRMHVEPFFDDPTEVDPRADLTIIVANASPWVGATAAISNSKGIPTVVLAQNLVAVVDNAECTQFPLELADVIARESISMGLSGSIASTLSNVGRVGAMALGTVGEIVRNVPNIFAGRPMSKVTSPFAVQPAASHSPYADMLDELAEWVMRNAPAIRTAFSKSFPFAREAKIRSIIRSAAYQNAVTAAVFFMPGADLPVMTTNQVKMLIQLERQYGYGLDKQTIFEAAAIVVFAFMSRTVVRKVCKSVPMLSWFVKILAGYLITLGMGQAIMAYCETGRDILSCPACSWIESRER